MPFKIRGSRWEKFFVIASAKTKREYVGNDSKAKPRKAKWTDRIQEESDGTNESND